VIKVADGKAVGAVMVRVAEVVEVVDAQVVRAAAMMEAEGVAMMAVVPGVAGAMARKRSRPVSQQRHPFRW
jgi:hypothetical protein